MYRFIGTTGKEINKSLNIIFQLRGALCCSFSSTLIFEDFFVVSMFAVDYASAINTKFISKTFSHLYHLQLCQ